MEAPKVENRGQLLLRGDTMDTECCEVCGGTPCDWDTYGEEVVATVQHTFESVEAASATDNGPRRKAAYQAYTYLRHGHLGKGWRIPIPECVVKAVRNRWPSQDGQYMGFIPGTEGKADI
jgi:hypothetical protein